jgi:hypothetical protein
MRMPPSPTASIVSATMHHFAGMSGPRAPKTARHDYVHSHADLARPTSALLGFTFPTGLLPRP